jgi:hypothetical protein
VHLKFGRVLRQRTAKNGAIRILYSCFGISVGVQIQVFFCCSVLGVSKILSFTRPPPQALLYYTCDGSRPHTQNTSAVVGNLKYRSGSIGSGSLSEIPSIDPVDRPKKETQKQHLTIETVVPCPKKKPNRCKIFCPFHVYGLSAKSNGIRVSFCQTESESRSSSATEAPRPWSGDNARMGGNATSRVLM